MQNNEKTPNRALQLNNVELVPFPRSEGVDLLTDGKDERFKNLNLDYSWKKYNEQKIKKFQNIINSGISDNITIYGTPKRSSYGLFLNNNLFVNYNPSKNIKIELSKKSKPANISQNTKVEELKRNPVDIEKLKDQFKDGLIPYCVLHPEEFVSSQSECAIIEEPKVIINKNNDSESCSDRVIPEKGESGLKPDSDSEDKKSDKIVINAVKNDEDKESVDFNSEMEYELENPSKMMSKEEVQELMRKRKIEKEKEREMELLKNVNNNANSGNMNIVQNVNNNISQKDHLIYSYNVVNKNVSKKENIDKDKNTDIIKEDLNTKDETDSNINMVIETNKYKLKNPPNERNDNINFFNSNVIFNTNNVVNSNVNKNNPVNPNMINIDHNNNPKRELSFMECMRLMDNSKGGQNNQNNIFIRKDEQNLSNNNITNINDIVDLEIKDIDDGIIEMKDETINKNNTKNNFKGWHKGLNINKNDQLENKNNPNVRSNVPNSFLDIVKNYDKMNENAQLTNKSMIDIAHTNIFKDNNYFNKNNEGMGMGFIDVIDIDEQDEKEYDMDIENELKDFRNKIGMEIYKDTTHVDRLIRKKYIEEFDPNDTYDFEQIEKQIVQDTVFYYKNQNIEDQEFKIKKLDYHLEKKKKNKKVDN